MNLETPNTHNLPTLTIPALLAHAVEHYRDSVVIEEEGTTLTFEELAVTTEKAARALIHISIQPGDRIAIWAPNIREWIIAALACHSVGAVLVPINTRFKGREACYVLEKSQARILFTIDGFLDNQYVNMLRDAHDLSPEQNPVEHLEYLEHIVVFKSNASPHTLTWDDFLAGSHEVWPHQAQQRAQAVNPHDLSDILFTSGTTGQPKGVMTTHEQNLQAFWSWTDLVGLRHGDRYLIVNPFFHAFGYKAGWLACLMRGATILPQPAFDSLEVLRRIATDRVTVLPGPPSLYQMILAHPDCAQSDLSSLRLAVTGAAVIPVELIHRMQNELHFETVITGYGLTEACGIATMCRHDDDDETIANTSGRAIPGVDVRVIDAQGHEVPSNEPGEIIVKGYNVMQGYLDDEEQTADAIDPEGWLRTGDIGMMDEQGYLRITDRKKDMFIMGGFNCYPAEIETMLLGCPGITQAAVVGVPDARMGEVAMAFAVRDQTCELTTHKVIEWCRDNMANFKVPRYVEFVDALPLNATGKVQKFVLREWAQERGHTSQQHDDI